jgi:hypothetical protein
MVSTVRWKKAILKRHDLDSINGVQLQQELSNLSQFINPRGIQVKRNLCGVDLWKQHLMDQEKALDGFVDDVELQINYLCCFLYQRRYSCSITKHGVRESQSL